MYSIIHTLCSRPFTVAACIHMAESGILAETTDRQFLPHRLADLGQFRDVPAGNVGGPPFRVLRVLFYAYRPIVSLAAITAVDG